MIDKSSLLKSQGSLYLEFIPKDELFHKMLLLSLMELLTGWCNLQDRQYETYTMRLTHKVKKPYVHAVFTISRLKLIYGPYHINLSYQFFFVNFPLFNGFRSNSSLLKGSSFFLNFLIVSMVVSPAIDL